MRVFTIEIIYFLIVRISIHQYDYNNIYHSGIDIIQFLYFIALFIVTLYFSISHKKKSTLLINSTIFLIIYSTILRIFIKSIAVYFTNIQGIINFANYAGKIYFICLPLSSFRLLCSKNSFFNIILFFITTVLFQTFFDLNGLLYSIPFYEFICFSRIVINYFTQTIKQGGFYGRFNNFK